jgi:uncharacterized protein involved in type VI secretion and phage assembly
VSGGTPLWGKYRGVVSDINDPLMTMRIKAKVPDVYGDDESGWAMPCAPFGGDGVGFLALPKKGAGVWIEFEHGDPDYPIWSGGWWGGPLDPPSEAKTPVPFQQKIILKTPGGSSLIIDDSPGPAGGIFIKTSAGQKISLTALGIEIDNGKGASIKMVAGNVVSVNNGGLDVT